MTAGRQRPADRCGAPGQSHHATTGETMRVSMLLLGILSLFICSASGQDWRGPTGTISGGFNPSGANEYSLAVLERAAFLGQREASALLAVQDAADVENSLVKSALHFQVAIAAGCSDLDILAAHAVERLSGLRAGAAALGPRDGGWPRPTPQGPLPALVGTPLACRPIRASLFRRIYSIMS
jgi:hypothetical protein